MMDLSECLNLVSDLYARRAEFSTIQGWLDPVEGYVLLLLAERVPSAGVIVEIGTFMGLSTAYLAIGAKRGGRGPVIAIDHFRGSPTMQKGAPFEVPEIVSEGSTYRFFEENMRRLGLADDVVAWKTSSFEAARKWTDTIQLLFIDGEHSYEASRQDFELFESHVAPGGVVCFHDIGSHEGVTSYFNEVVLARADYCHLRTVASLGIIQKRLR